MRIKSTIVDGRRRGARRLLKYTRIVSVVALLLAVTSYARAQTVFRNPDFEYVVDLPAGWHILDGENAEIVSFADPNRVAVFQIIAFPGSRFATAEAVDRHIRERFDAAGDSASFRYLGEPAIFADYRFSTGRFEVRGYMSFLNRDEFDYAVMTYVSTDHYEAYHDHILSVLDSFSPDIPSRAMPGPVSQFFSADRADRASDGEAGATITLPSGVEYVLPPSISSPEIREAHQILIEREARVLSSYAPPPESEHHHGAGEPPWWVTAWRRYFRMLYRDSFDRLQPVAEAIFMDLASAGVARDDMPARIVEWLQTARYERTASLSDLMNPASCLVEFAGDCDSLGLTYAILLHHLGFEAIMMVSMEFAHAMVGVDVSGEGARFPFEGREWLVAELTEEVGIGRIAADMSEISAWIGVKLDPTIRW